jgi:hypothetical protein
MRRIGPLLKEGIIYYRNRRKSGDIRRHSKN